MLRKEQRSHNNAAAAVWVAWGVGVIQVGAAVIQVVAAAIQAEAAIQAAEGIQPVEVIQPVEDIQTAVEDTRTAMAVRPQ